MRMQWTYDRLVMTSATWNSRQHVSICWIVGMGMTATSRVQEGRFHKILGVAKALYSDRQIHHWIEFVMFNVY